MITCVGANLCFFFKSQAIQSKLTSKRIEPKSLRGAQTFKPTLKGQSKWVASDQILNRKI